MSTLLLLLLSAPLTQEPAATVRPPEPAAAQKAWDALQKRLAAAQGLSLHASMELADPAIPLEELMPVKMEIQLFLARPGAGRASWTSVFGEGEEAETVVLDWIGTGEKVFAVDHEEKWVSAEGREWKDSELGFFLPFLGPTWATGSFEARDYSFLPPLVDHSDWQGLLIHGDSEEEEADGELAELRIWIAPDGLLRRAVSSLGGTAVMKFEFNSMKLAEKVELKDYVMAIPEGYEVLDEEMPTEGDQDAEFALDASLLPVGAEAPAALLTGLDEVEFALSALRGKTVLLNFWFYH